MQKTKKIIDPHIHLFNLDEGKYAWLQAKKPPFWEDKKLICKNTFESDLCTHNEIELEAFVHIEAGFDNAQPSRELAWLSQHCQLPFKAISYVNLSQASAAFVTEITRLSAYQSFVGIRDIVDQDFINRLNTCEIKTNLQTLADRNLLFELQVDFSQADHISVILDILSKVTKLKFSINHAGFSPFNNTSLYSNWEKTLSTFAKFSECFVKVSGFEMISREYSHKNCQQVLQSCCEVFASDRVMLASNFPLVRLGKLLEAVPSQQTQSKRLSYGDYWRNILQVSETLALNTADLSINNAKSFYSF